MSADARAADLCEAGHCQLSQQTAAEEKQAAILLKLTAVSRVLSKVSPVILIRTTRHTHTWIIKFRQICNLQYQLTSKRII